MTLACTESDGEPTHHEQGCPDSHTLSRVRKAGLAPDGYNLSDVEMTRAWCGRTPLMLRSNGGSVENPGRPCGLPRHLREVRRLIHAVRVVIRSRCMEQRSFKIAELVFAYAGLLAVGPSPGESVLTQFLIQATVERPPGACESTGCSSVHRGIS